MRMKGLGRGFESLIPTDLVDEEFDPTAEADEKVSKLVMLSLSEIVPDAEQPRKRFGEKELETLATSIKANGVVQPIVVTRLTAEERKAYAGADAGGGDKRYKIVAGERRYRASIKAGLTAIPAIVRSLSGQKRLEVSIIENAQREDLSAIELATAYAKLKTQFNLSEGEIAERIGKSKTAVGNTIRLLNLPEFAKKVMMEQNLPEGVMRPLISLEPEVIEEILPRIIEEGWTARRVEGYVKSLKPKTEKSEKKQVDYGEKAASILSGLQKQYKARNVKISARTITISFQNQEELEKYINKL